MPVKTRADVFASFKATLNEVSPQIHVDADKGPFFFLAGQAISQPLADVSADVERLAQLSTLQFPLTATEQEMKAVARAFGRSIGRGGYSRVIALVSTSQIPTGDNALTIAEGDSFGTAESGGVVFEALETRVLTSANASAYFNPVTRRYEVPVLVQAISGGKNSDIAARTLRFILSGAIGFTSVTNTQAATGGTAAMTARQLFESTQQALLGSEAGTKAGLLAKALAVDVDRISAAAMTYSSEYPDMFYRLPEDNGIDLWVYNTVQEIITSETFTASAGQTRLPLSKAPAFSLMSVLVNGSPVPAFLSLDNSASIGRSTREESHVIVTPLSAGDVVDITYSYDAVLGNIQNAIDGYYQADTGALFSTDVLVRYARELPISVEIRGTVIGGFVPTTVEQEVVAAIGDYITFGSNNEQLGGVRSPQECRDYIKANVPGLRRLEIVSFCRKDVGPIVEVIDIPRHSRGVIALTSDVRATLQ